MDKEGTPKKTRIIDIPLMPKQAEQLNSYQRSIETAQRLLQTTLETIVAGTEETWEGDAQIKGLVEGSAVLGGKKLLLRLEVPK